MMKANRILAAAGAAVFVLSASAQSFAAGQLNILTWEGYADSSFIKPFEKASGCKVHATYVGSNDDFAPKLAAGGGVYDLVSPSIDTTKPLIQAGFIQPLDTGKLKHWKNIYKRFRTAEGINMDGKVYGMPYAWGAISFMYRADIFKKMGLKPPTSIAALWNPKLKGHVSLWDDKSAIYVAARLNGDMNIYSLTDAQIKAAEKKLIEQKPLIRKYWSTAGELVDLYKSGEVWISNTWAGYQSGQLKKAGVDVKEFIPKENAEGWMDSFMIVKGTPNEECAYKFLNMESGKLGQCGVAKINNYSVANPEAVKSCMTPAEFKAHHQDDPSYLNKLLLWKNLGPRLQAYTNAWNEVKAAQ